MLPSDPLVRLPPTVRFWRFELRTAALLVPTDSELAWPGTSKVTLSDVPELIVTMLLKPGTPLLQFEAVPQFPVPPFQLSTMRAVEYAGIAPNAITAIADANICLFINVSIPGIRSRNEKLLAQSEMARG